MKKALTNLVLTGLITFGGCLQKPTDFVEGTVIKEYGTVARIVESSGALFGNESVKLGNPSYGLIVNAHDGLYTKEYTIEIDVDDISGNPGPQTAYNLAARIEEGTRIRFPTSFEGIGGNSWTRNPRGFSKERIGMLDPDDIEIIE